MIQVGEKLPDAIVYELIEDEREGCTIGPNSFDVREQTAGKRVVIFGLPGAFTPTCSARHVPGYVEHAAAFAAEPERGHPVTGRMRLRRRIRIGGLRAVGEQQDVAMPEAGIAQQALRPGDRAIRAVAVDRHHVRRQRIEEHRDVGGVFGQRRDGVGIVGEGDQCHLPAGAFAQQGRDLRPRLGQPRRRQVARQGGAGQVQRDDQRGLGLPQGMFRLAETRAGHRQQRQGGRQQSEPPRPLPARRPGGAIEQVRQQVRIHRLLPHAAALRARAPPPREEGQHQQAEQPPRAQEMQLRKIGKRGDGIVHARLRHTAANKPTTSAKASGHG